MPAGLWKQSLCQSFLYCCRYSSLCCRMISEFGVAYYFCEHAVVKDWGIHFLGLGLFGRDTSPTLHGSIFYI